MPTVSGVVETALYVDDLERSGRFYEDVFGFRQLLADDRMRAYSVADRQVLLLFQTGGSTQPSPMHGSVIPPHDGQGNLHLAFAVSQSEIAAWEEHLQEKGIRWRAKSIADTIIRRGTASISAIPTAIFWN